MPAVHLVPSASAMTRRPAPPAIHPLPILLVLAVAAWLAASRSALAQGPGTPADLEARMAAAHVFLPAMQPSGASCLPDLVVQNLGAEPSKAVLLTWGEPGFCPPESNGPLMAECSGLLAPGAAWTFSGPQVPTGSVSGALFSFNLHRLSELGLQLTFDDVAADLMCERLYYKVVGNGSAYASFLQAFRAGTDFAGLPLARLVGGPIGAQWIERCEGGQPGYNALRPAQASRPADDAAGGHLSFLPWVEPDWTLHVQNLGLGCAQAEVWFNVAPGKDKTCEVLNIAPGDARSLRVGDCVDRATGVWIRATQPVAVVARLAKGGHWATYGGQGTGGSMQHLVLPELGSGLRIYAQNPWLTVTATLSLRLRDTDGGSLLQRDFVVPPHQTALLRVAPEELGAAAGKPLSLFLESTREGQNPPASVIVVALSEALGDPDAIGAAWNLEGGERVRSGAALVGLPAVDRDAGSVTGASRASRILVHNAAEVTGFTEFAIYLHDQNGFLDRVCDRLNDRQTAFIDLQAWDFIHQGFRGSALISASFWEHDVFNPEGDFLHNVVALQAAVQEPGPKFGDPDLRPGLPGGGPEAGFAVAPALPPCPPVFIPGATPERPMPTPTASGPAPTPGSSREGAPDARSAYLPTVNVDKWGDGSCNAMVRLINEGSDASKVVLMTWGEPGFCPPASAGPLKVECSGLLKPGGSWNFSGPMLPTGSQAGMVFSFTARLLSELGLDGVVGMDDVAADFMCETLFFGVVGDGDDYRRFKAAFDQGAGFAGLPLWKLKGGPLAVTVQRSCAFGAPDQRTELRDSYAGIPGWSPPTGRDASGAFQAVLPGLPGGRVAQGDRSLTEISVQNTGLDCAGVDVWLAASAAWEPGAEDPPAGADCRPLRSCRQGLNLAPGESLRIPLADCVDAGETVAVILRGSQPLAAVADIADGQSLATVVSLPLAQRQWAMPLPVVPEGGRRILSLVNPNSDGALRVEVVQRPLDASEPLPLSVWICPQGQLLMDLDDARTGLAVDKGGLLLAFTLDLKGQPMGRVLWAGLAVVPAKGAAPALAMAPWGDDDRYLGAAVVALPIGQRVGADLAPSPAKVYVANTVRQPGFTDAALYVYDANGLTDMICQRLNAAKVEAIDLSKWGFVTPSFSGQLLVSASHWEHSSAPFPDNRVGLQAWATLAEGPGQPLAKLEGWAAGTFLGRDAYLASEGIAKQGLPPCPGASLPSASPTATPPRQVTATPFILMTATATTVAAPSPTPTSDPLQVCPQARARIPAAVLDGVRADPANVAGFDQLEHPGRPEGPFNLRRRWLSLERPDQAWNALFNGLRFKAGCP